MHQALILAVSVVSAALAQAPSAPTPIDHAFARLYDCDFAGALAILDEEQKARPGDPLVYAVRGATYLFSEFDRQHILEYEFFEDDDQVTDRRRVKSDPVVRDRLFKTTGEAKKLAEARLRTNPRDADALQAMSMALGVEADYLGIIEKRYVKTYFVSRDNQKYARRLLALDPPVYDAYVTIGSAEYVVANLNFFFRLIVRFDQVKGDREKAVAALEQVVEHGRFYRPFARVLLAVIHTRAKRPADALAQLRVFNAEFPANPVVKKEIARAEAKVRLASSTDAR